VTLALAAGSFFGDTSSVRIGDAVLSEVRHATGRTVPPHTHEHAYFCLLIEGAYRETSAQTTIEYDPFTVVFHAARREHTDAIGPSGGRFFMIELLPELVEAVDTQGALPAHFTELRGGECAWLMSRLYQEFLVRVATTEFAVESLLYQLCATAAGAAALPAEEPAWMGDVDGLIQSRIGQTTSVRELANAVHVHASHLCRVFHRFRGRTIGDYVVGLRMQHACRLIVETQCSLGEIAAEAGFADQSHMTRIFKRFVGETPAAYRNRLRAGFGGPLPAPR
jgi:AraC-like DNA-binding protein